MPTRLPEEVGERALTGGAGGWRIRGAMGLAH
jgi:hypothetical protein